MGQREERIHTQGGRFFCCQEQRNEKKRKEKERNDNIHNFNQPKKLSH